MRGSMEVQTEEVQNMALWTGDSAEVCLARLKRRKVLEQVQFVREGAFTKTSQERIDVLCEIIVALVGEE